MMKILVMSGATVGGEWVAVKRLFLGLKKEMKNSIKVDLVAWKPDYEFTPVGFDRVTFVEGAKRRGRLSFWFNLANDFKSLVDVCFAKKIDDYDYVFVTDYLMFLAAVYCRRSQAVQLYFWFHGIRSRSIDSWREVNHRQLIIKALERLAWILAEKILVPNVETAIYLKSRLGFWKKPAELVVLPNMVSAVYFSKISSLPSTGERIILYSGRIIRSKGLEELAKAVVDLKQKFPRICLTVAFPTQEADEDLMRAVKHITEMGGVTLKLLPNLNEREMAIWYKSCEVMVLPSKMEFAPLSIVEALAVGTICVGSMVGNIKSVLSPVDDRLILRSTNKEDLKSTLGFVLKLTAWERQKMIDRGRNVAEGYKPRAILKTFQEVLFGNLG
jgi:glycosyltransferase involved in cell wall biosynthesis